MFKDGTTFNHTAIHHQNKLVEAVLAKIDFAQFQ